jgi:hypothetical protein
MIRKILRFDMSYYELAWLKEELEYFKEWIEFCLYSDSEDAIKWRTDPYYSGVAEDGFKSIKKSVTEAEHILEEIGRSFSVQDYWKAIRLNASQLEWFEPFFMYERDALMRGMDARSKGEKQPESAWKCDCAMVDHLLKNIESKCYFHDRGLVTLNRSGTHEYLHRKIAML